eukprot:CAMPEP_0195246870 /NCGR_PEP_ID=MMETSP0706-20130129/634_1 /TAXON_ID=33640 /ORGANISM="Asterionellopsis glacialis, Strain CCMP134" /LENGTH=61 /DNA_ID=CAMNT_0040298277 /DNA_START=73 /DNA_END=259 /DNA_ORIENTATION=-
MMDPMANLDGGGAPGASKDDVDSKDAFDPMVLRLNLNELIKLDHIWALFPVVLLELEDSRV